MKKIISAVIKLMSVIILTEIISGTGVSNDT